MPDLLPQPHTLQKIRKLTKRPETPLPPKNLIHWSLRDPKFWKDFPGPEAKLQYFRELEPEMFRGKSEEDSLKWVNSLTSKTDVPDLPSGPDAPGTEFGKFAGSTTGAAAGTMALAPLGPVAAGVGAVTGAFVGGALGHHTFNRPDPFSGKEEISRSIRGSIRAGMDEAKWEALGGTAGAGLKLIAKGPGRHLIKETGPLQEELTKRMPRSKATGRRMPFFTSAERSRSKVINWIEGIARGGIAGGGEFAKHVEATDRVVTEIVDETLESMFPRGLRRLELGENLNQVLKTGRDAFHAEAKNVYQPLSRELQGVPFDTSDIQRMVQTGEHEIRPENWLPGDPLEIERLPTAGRGLRGFSSDLLGDAVNARLRNLAPIVDFDTAKELRTLMRKEAQKALRASGGAATEKVKVLRAFENKIGEMIDDTLQIFDASPQRASSISTKELWDGARAWYDESAKIFDNEFVLKLLDRAADSNQGPETVARLLLPGEEGGDITQLRLLKSALEDEPDAWRQTQRWLGEWLITDSKKAQDVPEHLASAGIIPDHYRSNIANGQKMLDRMFNENSGWGQDFMQEAFSPRQIKGLTTVAEALKIQQSQTERAGEMMIQLAQGGAIAGIAMGAGNRMAKWVVITPAIFARMVTSPATANLLAEGLTLPASSPRALGFMARMINYLHREDVYNKAPELFQDVFPGETEPRAEPGPPVQPRVIRRPPEG